MAEDVFKLKDLLEAKLLIHREAVEEIATAAVKEETIENKLRVIGSEWAILNLSFAEYKTRG